MDSSSSSWRSSASGESKKICRISSRTVLIGLTTSRRRAWQEYCPDSSRKIVYLRALQGHSGRNLIDPSLQDNVNIQSNFFQYIYHVGCAFNLHSIISSGLTPGSQSLSKRQTVLFLLADLMDKNHKDPDTIDLEAPRLAQYMHKAWKKHQNTVYWVDINLALKKGLKFHQTRSNAIIRASSPTHRSIRHHVSFSFIFFDRVVRVGKNESMSDAQ